MKIRSTIFIATIFLSVSAAPARADNCCRDFWTCAAAVASAGLSCAADVALQEINKFIAEAQRTQANGQQQYQASANQLANQWAQLRRLEEQRMGSAISDARSANLSAQNFRNTIAALQIDRESREILQNGVARIGQIENTVTGEQQSDFYEDLAAVNQTARDGLEVMNGVFVASFMAPMTALIGPLLSTIPDPLVTAATIAGMVATINHIKSEFDRKFPQSVTQSQQTIATAISGLSARRLQAANEAARAQSISQALQTAVNNPTQRNINQLNSLLNPGGSGGSQLQRIDQRAFTAQNQQLNNLPQVTQLSRGLPQKIDRSLTQLAASAQRTSRVTTQRLDTRAYQNQTNSYLDKSFKGRTAADIEKQRNKLISQANNRYKSDPKTRSGVVALIDERTQHHLKVVGSAPAQKSQKTTTKPKSNAVKPAFN